MARAGKAVPTAPLPGAVALVALGIWAVNLGAFLGVRRILGLPKLAWALVTLAARVTCRRPPRVKAGGWIFLMAPRRTMTF